MGYGYPLFGAVLLVAFTAAGSSDISSAYLAPANRLVYRITLPGGKTRDFRGINPSDPSVMVSADGWKLRFRDDGKSAVVLTSPLEARYDFNRGRIVRFTDAKGVRKFPYEMRRDAPSEVLSPLAFYEFEAGYFDRVRERQLAEKWEGANRLQFPNVNPNRSGAFYALLVLLGILLLQSSKRKLRVAGACLGVLSALALVWTGSRGSMLGLAVGLIPFAILSRFCFLRQRWFWIVSGSVLLAAAIWFGCVSSDSLTRGFTSQGVDWGNAVRLDMWKTAPKMMFDAPGGWAAAGPGAGRAYFDWYEPFGEISLTGNLMNDHLTVMADVGWFWRWGYVFLLTLVLAFSVVELVRRRCAFPLAVFSSLAAMAWFNPVYGAWTTWLVPAFAFAILTGGVAKRVRVRELLCALGASAAFALAVVGVVYAAGSAATRGDVRVWVDGPWICVNSPTPSVWVVDDEQGALGAMFAGRDIREFYRQHPQAAGIGYVRSIEALPLRAGGRLVLSGKAAQDWLLKLSESVEARRFLPQEVIMISPPFAPSEIPEGVLACCHPRVVVGEFAARFQPEYANPPAFVTVVPAMERYIFGWMCFALGK